MTRVKATFTFSYCPFPGGPSVVVLCLWVGGIIFGVLFVIISLSSLYFWFLEKVVVRDYSITWLTSLIANTRSACITVETVKRLTNILRHPNLV